jgi:hypothetical protein
MQLRTDLRSLVAATLIKSIGLRDADIGTPYTDANSRERFASNVREYVNEWWTGNIRVRTARVVPATAVAFTTAKPAVGLTLRNERCKMN